MSALLSVTFESEEEKQLMRKELNIQKLMKNQMKVQVQWIDKTLHDSFLIP